MPSSARRCGSNPLGRLCRASGILLLQGMLLGASTGTASAFVPGPHANNAWKSASAIVGPRRSPAAPSSGTTSSAINLKLLTRDRDKMAKKRGKKSDKKRKNGQHKAEEGEMTIDVDNIEVINGEKGGHSTSENDKQHRQHQDTPGKHQLSASSNALAAPTDVFNLTDSVVNMTDIIEDFSKNVTVTIEEMNRQMTDGTKDILGNMTVILEEKLLVQPAAQQQAMAQQSSELLTYIAELNEELTRAQKREMERQMMELEKVFVRPLEDFAFSDAKLATLASSSSAAGRAREVDEEAKRRDVEEHRRELILTGANSTVMETSRRLKTSEILRNLNVAPLYYSITLLFRWINKVKGPPMAALSFFRGLSALFGSPSKVRGGRSKKKMQSYDEFMKDAKQMQAGWKRTGEIAAKGPLARKWAIMRRSAEIWGYFASFYLKEKRMENKFNSGKWSAEKFSEERSKLGAEVTQNLLKLGPTFIKVRSNMLLYCLSRQIFAKSITHLNFPPLFVVSLTKGWVSFVL